MAEVAVLHLQVELEAQFNLYLALVYYFDELELLNKLLSLLLVSLLVRHGGRVLPSQEVIIVNVIIAFEIYLGG